MSASEVVVASFSLHPDFRSKIPLGSLPLCEVFLEPNQHYLWLILVPRIAGALRLLDLDSERCEQLWRELHLVQRIVWSHQPLSQLNVAQLGNRCPQLHLHVVGRRADDPAWPDPVWGHPVCEPYTPEQRHALKARLQMDLAQAESAFEPALSRSCG